jgi:hypothetical protein
VLDLLGPPAPARRGSARAIFTSGRAPHAVLTRFGIEAQPAAVSGAD